MVELQYAWSHLHDGVEYRVGDIVTRNGEDRHRIIGIPAYDLIEVECIHQGLTGAWQVGEVEVNSAYRYEHLDAIEGTFRENGRLTVRQD